MKLFRIKITVLIISLLLPFASLQAQVWNQIGNVIKGAAAEDFFGSSVSLSADGSVIAIGGPYNDGNGFSAGHVRIFENQGGIWSQIGGAIEGETAGDWYGYSVSISADGSIIAIGALLNDGNGTSAGHVRIFENQGGNWSQIGGAIDGEAAGDNFGSSVSISSDGSIVAIGTPYKGLEAGHVRVFENQGGTWSQIGGSIEGEASGDWFGSSVSISSDGSIVAIGAPRNDGNGTSAGHVRIFENQGGTWSQIGCSIEGETSGDWFGYSTSISADGSIVAIGGLWNDVNGIAVGHVRIFENQNGAWSQIGNAVEGIAAEDKLGSSVSLNASGSILATGAPENDANGTNAGLVGVFENSTVSRESIQRQSFSFFPNPTTGSFQVNGLTTGSKETKIEVYDMSGEMVFTKEYDDDSPIVNIANLTPGIYFVKLTAQGQTAVRKVVKL